MRDLLEYIVKNLVSKPEAVQIDEQSGGGTVDLTLTVHPDDMGMVIGKGGQTIRAIRKILTVRAIAENVRVNLQLAEPGSVDQRVSESADQQNAEETEQAEEPKEDEEKPQESGEQ